MVVPRAADRMGVVDWAAKALSVATEGWLATVESEVDSVSMGDWARTADGAADLESTVAPGARGDQVIRLAVRAGNWTPKKRAEASLGLKTWPVVSREACARALPVPAVSACSESHAQLRHEHARKSSCCIGLCADKELDWRLQRGPHLVVTHLS